MPANPEKEKAFSKEHLSQCKGYDPTFIDGTTSIALNILSDTQKKKLPVVEGNAQGVLHYSRYSVLYNKSRRVPFVSAANIDGAKKIPLSRDGSFKPDPRVNAKHQLSDKFYDLVVGGETEFDIGHMTSNNEMCWSADARLYAYETFHFTNSVPQASKVNRGLWSGLEGYIVDEARAKKTNQKIAVFTGPVLKTKDPVYINDETFQVPLLFWKVVVFKKKTGFHAAGFVMSHEKKLREMNLIKDKKKTGTHRDALAPDEDELAFQDYPYKKVFQINIETIEKLTGLKLNWANVARIAVHNDKLQLKKLGTVTSAADAGNLRSVHNGAAKPVRQKLNMIL